MAVKRYDGSAWQTVAGLGAQGAAATSSSIATWVKTASGGETSLSGNDDSSQALSYTIGQELVFINGVLQKRNDDYVANTGNSITGLTALTAGDIVSVWTVNAFSVSNAISNTIVDAKGDILVGTGADTPGRLAVGTNGQVLTAASTTGTGLAWTTLATPTSGLTLITRQTISGSSGTNIDSVFTTTYKTYMIVFESCDGSVGGADFYLQFRYGSTTMAQGYKYQEMLFSTTQTNTERNGINQIILTPNLGGSTTDSSAGQIMITRVAVSDYPMFWFDFTDVYSGVPISGRGINNQQQTYTGIRVSPSSGTFSAKVAIYGLAS